MNHFIPVIAVALLISAWMHFRNSKNRTALLLLILGGFLIRFFIDSDLYIHAWDERFHALVSKNMRDNLLVPKLYLNPILEYDYKSWISNHVWLHKQPFPLWSMALSMKLFGVNEFALRLPSLILSTLSIWLTYDLGKRLFNLNVAFVSGFLMAIQGLVLEIGSGRIATDHIDLFFLVLIELAVWLSLIYSEKHRLIWNILCGVAIGLAILTKWLPAFIVLPVWLLFNWQNRKSTFQFAISFVTLVIISLIISLPWQIYINTKFPLEATWESSFNFRHITESLEGMGGEFYYHFDKMRIVYGELVYIPLLWFIVRTIRKKTDLKHWAVLIWLLVPYLFFSIAKTKMQGYTLFTSPALLLICALFWDHLVKEVSKFRYPWFAKLLALFLIILPVRYAIERIKPFNSEEDRNPKWAQELKELKLMEKTIIFNVNHPIEVMFYTDAVAYDYIPASEVLDSLSEEGYNILINGSHISNYNRYYKINLTLPRYGK